MGVLRSGARGNMPATAKRLASWRVLKEMLQSFLRRCSLLDVLESLTVGTCVQHFFQVLSRGGGSLAQVFACPGHNFFFPCPILRFACPVFVDKCKKSAISPCSCITELFGTSSPNQHEEIRAGEEHMELIEILLEPFVSYLPVTEVTFHNQKSVFYLTPDRRFPVLNELIPVEPFEQICCFQAARSFGNPKRHRLQLFVV